MAEAKSWRVCSSGVTHQNIEGEVIAIHIARGTYHSLTGAAAVVWSRIESAPLDAASLAAGFENAPADAEDRVRGILSHLEEQDLIEAGDPEPDASHDAVAWEEPVVESFDDMQDLLLADPIHDVDERGWPSLAPAHDDGK